MAPRPRTPGAGAPASPGPAYEERVLRLVEAVPPGRVLPYGALAALLGEGGPRQVGRVLAGAGGGVPWWRVLRADGSHAPPLAARALPLLRAEGTPLRPDGLRVDVARALWRPGPGEVAAALGDLAAPGDPPDG
ncbi:MGMT family protein [Vallicoccus soli]|uniref:Cysteine methyltransferase n=1 Tax=Vallicoccus soli TaxID=2339232 RepID=A0A3A3ZMW0_9ACTN|nr:MGMT family protein [Vallicoccus soli]RJK98071.1 cysteine methyltransferase [Vallicoccus soli]